jgi:hypothetical protein
MTATTNADLSGWIGKAETVNDTVTQPHHAVRDADHAPRTPAIGTPLPGAGSIFHRL